MVMVNFVENEEERSDTNSNSAKDIFIKDSKSDITNNHIKGMKGVVKKLEGSLTDSHLEQRHLLIQMHIDDIKNQNVTSQLEEARKENKQLLNILQRKCHDGDAPRSPVDVSPAYSTMSVVNLQYKYEELLAKYEGLLKVMTSRDKDIQKCHKENETVMEDLNNTNKKLRECEHTLKKVCEKYVALKHRRNIKINELKAEKETLRSAHNQLVILLHEHCMKNEDILAQELQKTVKPERALLLQEVQRSNKLQHENILLKQEMTCLKANCKFPDLRSRNNIPAERSKSVP